MKKRLIGLMLTLVMILSFVPSLAVFAETTDIDTDAELMEEDERGEEYLTGEDFAELMDSEGNPTSTTYKFNYTITTMKANCHESDTDNGSLSATIYFEDGTETTFQMNKKDGNERYGSSGADGRPPWMVKSYKVVNSSNNAYRVYKIKMKVNLCDKNGNAIDSERKMGPTHYPGDWHKEQKSGTWIESGNDNRNNYIYGKLGDHKRNFSKIVDWEKFSGTMSIDTGKAYNEEADISLRGSVVGDRWNGMLGAGTSRYNFYRYRYYPKMTFEVSGTGRNSFSVTWSNLTTGTSAPIILTENNGIRNGFKINKNKMRQYMDKNGVNTITIDTTLTFEHNTINWDNLNSNMGKVSGQNKLKKQYRINRKCLEVEEVKIKSDPSAGRYFASEDNYYFNRNSKKIKVDVDLFTSSDAGNANDIEKAGATYSHINYNFVRDAKVKFDKAELVIGNRNDNNILTLGAETTGKKLTYYGLFTLEFATPMDIDSSNVGMTLNFTNLRCTYNGQDYYIVQYKSDGMGRPGEFSYFLSEEKLDTKKPEITAEFTGDDIVVNGWRKRAKIKYTPSENLFTSTSFTQIGSATVALNKVQNAMSYRLHDREQENVTYALLDQDGRTLAKNPWYRASANMPAEILVECAEGAEVDGVIKIERTSDIANNSISGYELIEVKLDSLAPRVKPYEEEVYYDEFDGSITRQFNFDIEDASGTGRVYYVFTEKNVLPEFTGSENIPEASGTVDTIMDRWAFVSQIPDDNTEEMDKTNGSAVLKVEKGESFHGHLYYFTADAFDNGLMPWFGAIMPRNVKNIAIDIDNPDTDCVILPDGDPSKPQSSYSIEIITGEGNSLSYRWLKDGMGITDSKPYTSPAEVGSGVQTGVNGESITMDGEYTLEVTVTSGSVNKRYTQNVVFDNTPPVISFTNANANRARTIHSIRVTADDASGVNSVTALLIRGNGDYIEGEEAFKIEVDSGSAGGVVNVTGVESGEYALEVTAVDNNGFETIVISEPFYIRNGAPAVTITPSGELEYGGEALVSNDYTLNIKAEEKYIGTIEGQHLYYRIAPGTEGFGNWIDAGEMDITDDGYSLEFEVKPTFALSNGRNEITIQSVIGAVDFDLEHPEAGIVGEDKVVLYFDNKPPEYGLVMEEGHTNAAIKGQLTLIDNMSEVFTFDTSAFGDAVKVEYSEELGKYVVTVTDNVDGFLYAVDQSGNRAEIPLTITCLDFEGPEVTNVNAESITSGARVDGEITFDIEDAVKDTIRFAIIPEEAMADAIGEDGNILEYYIMENSDKIDEETEESIEPDAEKYVFSSDEEINAVTITLTGEKIAEEMTEVDLSYNIKLQGVSGTYYIGISASDSIGNRKDTLLDEYPIELVNAEAELEGFTVSPKEANLRSKVTVDFNIPVFVLPQGQITDAAIDELTVDETNLETAKLYAFGYAEEYSFLIGDVGEYELYTVDDIGRGRKITIDVTDEMVSFGNVGIAKAQTVVLRGDMPDALTFIPFDTDEYPDARRVIEGNELVSPYYRYAADSQSDTYITLMEVIAPDYCYLMPVHTDGWDDEEGLLFFEEFSANYLADSENPAAGYTRLYYMTSNITVPVYNEAGEWVDSYYANKFDRTAEIMIRTDSDGPDVWGTQFVTIENIDNTPPNIKYTVEPANKRDDEYNPLYYTLGDVTTEIAVTDPELGLYAMDITVNSYDDEFTFREIIEFEGVEYPYVVDNEYFTLTISGSDDIKGTKLVTIVAHRNIFISPFFVNKGMNFANLGDGIEGIEIDYINKIDISENDYSVSYEYKDAVTDKWLPISEGVYFREARATIEPTSQGMERGVYVLNNNGENKKVLTHLNDKFTFTLADRYGYSLDVRTEVSGFDVDGGEIEYKLGTLEKTNNPVEVQITVSDELSGIGKVEVTTPYGTMNLTEDGEGIYRGEAKVSGDYTITLTDKAGNVTRKSFHVTNIDATVPEIKEQIYNTKERTAKTVIVTLTYNKPDVVITGYEVTSGLENNGFVVDTNNSIIQFKENGSLSVWFTDAFGNVGADVVTVENINTAPPKMQYLMAIDKNKRSVDISFIPAEDEERDISEITVVYNGMAAKAEEAKYTFGENGFYTFTFYDEERVASHLTIEIADIDIDAPRIVKISWSYDHDVLGDNGEWTTQTTSGYRDVGNEAGYRIATDNYHVTKNDVTVTVETDSATRIKGNEESVLGEEHTLTYTDNGMYIFNMEKENERYDTYGFDVAVIDKEPPVIELKAPEIVFYEREESNKVPYSKDLIAKAGEAFVAYDTFGGIRDLSDRVVIDYGNFNPDDITQNKFDRTIQYTITYTVWDDAHNETEAKMNIRLVGFNDSVVLVNDTLPDYAGRSEVKGKDKIILTIGNFAGVSYARVKEGVHTMGQMKITGEQLSAADDGTYEFTPEENGWYTFLVQTDKRDYFTVQVFFYK